MHDVFFVAVTEASVDTIALTASAEVADTTASTGVGVTVALVTPVDNVEDTTTESTMTEDGTAEVEVGEATAVSEIDGAGVDGSIAKSSKTSV